MDQRHIKKPVWAEGVSLGQQHLQIQDLYNEKIAAARYDTHVAYPYGFHRIEVDNSLLLQGVVSLIAVDLVFEGGRFLSYRQAGTSEIKCSLGTDISEAVIYIALAKNNIVSNIEGYKDLGLYTAYSAEYVNYEDLHNPLSTREVAVAQPNLVLFSDVDSKSNFHYLPALKLKRNLEGGWEQVHQFIPPLLNTKTSRWLNDFVKRCHSLIQTKSKLLLERRREFNTVNDFSVSETSGFLLLNTLLPAEKKFHHFVDITLLHPERLYLELCSLVSRLALFENIELIEEIPAYQHKRLTEVFGKFEVLILQLLSGIVPKRLVSLEWKELSQSKRVIETIDLTIFQTKTFYLAVKYNGTHEDWIKDFTDHVFVGSALSFDGLAAGGIGGVPITHKTRLPDKMVLKQDYEYFRIEEGGDWGLVIEHQSLGLFVPAQFQSSIVEVVTVDKD